jgi:hypothetical protein
VALLRRRVVVPLAISLAAIIAIPVFFSLATFTAQIPRLTLVSLNVNYTHRAESPLVESDLESIITSSSISQIPEVLYESLSPVISKLNTNDAAELFLTSTELTLNLRIKVDNPGPLDLAIDQCVAHVVAGGYNLTRFRYSSRYIVPARGEGMLALDGLMIRFENNSGLVRETMRLDFKMEMDVELECRVSTPLITRIVNGEVNTLFYLVPPIPSLEGIIVGSFLGHFLVTLTNNNEVPLRGEIVVGIVSDPTPLNDAGFMNFLVLKHSTCLADGTCLGAFSWRNEVTIDPHSEASMTIYESHLKPGSPYAIVVLWEPLFDEIPYRSTFTAGSRTINNFGAIVLDKDDVEAETIFQLVRSFGYLGNLKFTATDR